MNDLTQIPDSGTEFQFSDSVVHDMIRQRQLYQNTQVAQGMEGDADTAAHAVRLESATGLPATVITPNYDQFVDQQKKLAAQEIVNGNTDLQSYIMSHPLATTISNDDWATLDKFTRESSAGLLKTMADATNPTPKVVSDFVGSVLEGAVQGFEGGTAFNSGDEERRTLSPQENRFGTLGAAAATMTYGLADLAVKLGYGFAGGASAGLDKLGFSGPEIEATLADAGGATMGHAHVPEDAFAGQKAAVAGADSVIARVKPQTALDIAAPYIAAREEPPAGLHPEIDAHKAALNAEFLTKLEEDLSNAVASTTRERAPELFAKLTERMYGESTISLHADAALGLYGDKLPAADDKLLGWVPGIDTQLAAARDIGSDVQIPLKHWMAQVDPEVAKAVRDDIRVWPGGVTANEAKELPTEPKAIINEALPSVRAGAGLEPKFSIGDRKLSLGLFDKTADEDLAGKPYEMHDYDINDENGTAVGKMRLVPGADGKTLYVDYIGGKAGLWANSFGPALVRDLKTQLKGLYPDYEYLTGHRVTGARVGLAAAGEETPMPLPRVRLAADGVEQWSAADHQKTLDILQNGWERSSTGSSMLVNRQAPEFYTREQMALGHAAADEIAKLTGSRAEPQGVAAIHMQGQSTSQKIRGAYQPMYDSAPKIFYDLLGPDPVGIGRHESIHMLRDYGMFTHEEWNTLQRAAMDEGWLDRYGINGRYSNLGEDAKFEEAIAEGFREWAAQAEDVRPKTGVGALFQKIWDFLDRIRQGMGKYLGREPTWDEVFQRTASGEVGQRTPGVPGQEGQFRFSVEDERKANIEGMQNLQAASIGMDAQSFRRIQDAIRKQGEEDLRRETVRAEKEETKRQTREWKANRSEMAKEVAPEIRQRPDVAADLFVGSGELYGQKLKQRIPLAEDRLTPEQKAALPDHYYAKSGVDPDHVAGLFGLQSGDELVASLARTEALKNVGGKRMRAEDFIRKIISDETDRRMEMRYGDLQANILDAAKDSALSKSSLNVMHEELMAVAQKAGVTAFDRATIDKAAQGLINEFPLGKINSFRVMQEMGRHARNAEKAIAKGDWAEAVLHMQKQTVAAHVAAEAKRLEGEIAKFDKVAKRWAKRDQPSVPVEFGNWVHDILQRIGKPVRMTPEDLQRQIRGESATAQTFEEFVREQSEMGSAIDAWEGLLDPKWNKPYKTLTAEEFRGVRDTVQTLIETGRLTKKIVAQGMEFDREEVIGQLIDKVRELPFKSVDAQGKESIVTRMPKGYLTRALQAETIFGRWDGFDPWGVWTQKVFRDLKDADNQADAWRKEYSKRLSALEDGVDLNKSIANKVFKAPVQYGGGFVSMNRGSLRAVMLNLGSESNIAKLTKGWQVDEKAVRAFVDAHATAEDWKFVQGVWDIFAELKEKSDTMYRSMGRMASKTIEAQPVETPHGTFRGGYYPVMFHEVYAKVPKVESASGLLDPSYESLTPNAGYTVARKNFFQPLTMRLDRLPGRLNQVIHDTAMRPSVENFGKVMYDGRVKAAIQTHAGIEVYDNMVNYIKGVANKANTGVQLWKDGAAVSSFMRQNIMAGLVGFNPGTILKHGFTAAGLSMKEVGLPRFFNAVRSLHSVDKATGESNYQFAMQHSLELQRRDRNFDESLHGAVGNLSPVQDVRLVGKNLGPVVEKFLDYRQRLIEMSGKPLAFSDKLSSVPTWLAAYDKHIEEGMTHGDAVFAADRAVRRAHGSTSITSRPTLMNELNPWLTTFYNFFNDVFNRQTETLWRAGEAMDLAKKGQWGKARGVAGTVAAGVFAYSIWPALVENWVTPQENDPKDGWAKRAAKGMAFTEGATLPVVRDFTSMLLEGKNPDVGLFSTAYEHGTDLIRDLEKKQPLAPAHTQGLIRASSELLALFTGAPEQFGKLASGAYGLAVGTEHPRGPWAWGVLGRYGTLKGHSQTAGQYLAGQYERRR